MKLIVSFWSMVVKTMILVFFATTLVTAALAQANWIQADSALPLGTQLATVATIAFIWFTLSLITLGTSMFAIFVAFFRIYQKRGKEAREIWKETSIQTIALMLLLIVVGAVSLGTITLAVSIELTQLLLFPTQHLLLPLPWEAVGRIPLISLVWLLLWGGSSGYIAVQTRHSDKS